MVLRTWQFSCQVVRMNKIYKISRRSTLHKWWVRDVGLLFLQLIRTKIVFLQSRFVLF